MEYRASDPMDMGFEDYEDAQLALQDYVQGLMSRATPNDIMDTLVMLANVASIKAALHPAKDRQEWYRSVEQLVRGLLDTLGESQFARPNVDLENPELYFPRTCNDIQH